MSNENTMGDEGVMERWFESPDGSQQMQIMIPLGAPRAVAAAEQTIAILTASGYVEIDAPESTP